MCLMQKHLGRRLAGASRRIVTTTFALVCFGVCAQRANAGTITYDFYLDTPDGHAVTHVALFATNGAGQDDIFFSPVVVPASGRFQLQHTVPFTATAVMLAGVTERDKDDLWDIIMWVNPTFADAAVGVPFYQTFPADSNVGHNVLALAFQSAQAGDSGAQAYVSNFFHGAYTTPAYFSPDGSYSILKFSTPPPPIGGNVPEPGTVGLVGVAGVLLLLRKRRAT
jgi:hypothetical protein